MASNDMVHGPNRARLEADATFEADATASTASVWPPLPLSQWRQTRDTLQLWLQIVGKVQLRNTPLINHWWNVPLHLTARGLTTSLMQHPDGESFQIDVDLHEHRLEITTVAGSQRAMALRSMPMPDFYRRLMALLDGLGLHTDIWPMPVEIEGALRFDRDDVHGTYEPAQAHRFWQALVAMLPVFTDFRARFLGKASPIHLFWGGLDFATTRFSGRTAPAHPGGAPNCGPHVMAEAYSHEVSSCGYWPDGGPEGVFYSYAYPTPPRFSTASVRPAEARWSEDSEEFLLPYETVRRAVDPKATLLVFLQSTYEAAANAAEWDRNKLERRTPKGSLNR